MKILTDTGNYTHKASGKVYQYSFDYTVYESSDGCENSTILSLANRQAKVDANNNTRVKEQAKNGHSTRPVLTPEQKQANKAKKEESKAILAILAEKGITSLEEAKKL